jgi:hypothetical protein
MVYALTGYFRDALGGGRPQAFAVAVLAAFLFFARSSCTSSATRSPRGRDGHPTHGIDLWFFGGVPSSTATRLPRRGVRISAAGPRSPRWSSPPRGRRVAVSSPAGRARRARFLDADVSAASRC